MSGTGTIGPLVRTVTTGTMPAMSPRPTTACCVALLALVAAVSACAAPATTPEPTAPPSVEASATQGGSASPALTSSIDHEPSTPPELLPPDRRAWFGMNLDWGNDTVAAIDERLGVTPAAWVQFVAFPLGDGDRANLAGFFEQVGAVGGIGLITLEPHGGLETVTADAASALAATLDDAWRVHGVRTLVRFAHEMNGSWYPWGQRPAEYVDAFRVVAEAVHDGSPASAMVWAPNDGAGYPFLGGRHAAAPGSAEAAALDTDGDGQLTGADDPYAPYYPGDDAVDWVGMSVYFWGLAYPWGENEIPPEGRFAAQITGRPTGAHDDERTLPDFYATWSEARDKPMAIIETAALYDPAGGGPPADEVKGTWFRQVFSDETRRAFPRLGLISWFEWAKQEAEVDAWIDWRLTADPALARELLDSVPDGWLEFAPDRPGADGGG